MPAKAFIDTEIVLLSPEEGGRITPVSPLAYGGRYRPHIVIQARDTREPKIEIKDGLRCCVEPYVSVAFWTGDDPMHVGSRFRVTLSLWAYPHEMYQSCRAGATFTLREGSKIIGHGKILRFWIEDEGSKP